MKKDNANVLTFIVYEVGEECPFSNSDVQATVKAEWLRARLKEATLTWPNLTVGVSCLRVNSESGNQLGYSMSIEVDFCGESVNGEFFRHGTIGYGRMVVVGPDESPARTHFLDAIGKQVETALTDYLEANFGD